MKKEDIFSIKSAIATGVMASIAFLVAPYLSMLFEMLPGGTVLTGILGGVIVVFVAGASAGYLLGKSVEDIL